MKFSSKGSKFSPKEAKGFPPLLNSGSPCQHSLFSILENILHKSRKIFVDHALYVTQSDTVQLESRPNSRALAAAYYNHRFYQ